MSNISVYQLWCLASLFKTKTVSRVSNYLQGHINEVDRVDQLEDQGYIQFIYDHIQNLLKHPNHIIDHIYLGSGIHAMNSDILEQFDIKSILNVTEELPQYFDDEDYDYRQLSVRDTRDAFLMNHYEEAFTFFEECEAKDKKVLVHCYMGSSRSASTIIYYMIRKYNYSFDDAFQYLKERRPHVNLNTNFESELRQYEQLQRLKQTSAKTPETPETPQTPAVDDKEINLNHDPSDLQSVTKPESESESEPESEPDSDSYLSFDNNDQSSSESPIKQPDGASSSAGKSSASD